jgi:rhodanese-related sulfurtransferase
MSAATDSGVRTLSTAEVRQLQQSRKPFEFWNVLTDEYFHGENISGSRRVPLDRVGNETREKNIAKSAEIVVYCAGPECPMSRLAAEKLTKLGYGNVRAYEGGLEEWKNAGLPIERV